MNNNGSHDLFEISLCWVCLLIDWTQLWENENNKCRPTQDTRL